MSSSRLVFVHAWTPLHAGTGQGVGSIDLPIARERATGLPLVPGSSIKGCLRDALSATEPEKTSIFGPLKIDNENGHAGALRVGDARLTLLPVRSLSATFVWITSPFNLRRLKRDAEACGLRGLPAISPIESSKARTTAATGTVNFGSAKRLVLEELDLLIDQATQAEATEWATWFSKSIFPTDPAWQAEFQKRFAVVSDETFTFLAEFATEVNAHIRIDDQSGIVADGALWYQECLPAESILVTCFQAEHSRKKDCDLKADEIIAKATAISSLQLGGKATTGLGVVKLIAVAAKD